MALRLMLDILSGQHYTFDDTQCSQAAIDVAKVTARVTNVESRVDTLEAKVATKVSANFDGEVLNLIAS